MIPWKYQLWHFQVFRWKFAKFLMSFSKPQVSFSWNFEWPFSVIKDNSSVLFWSKVIHPATRRCGDVITLSLYTSQRRRRYVSNETPNDVSVERRQVVSVIRLHDVLLERRERRDGVLTGRNNDVSSVRLHIVSNKSQMKHSTTYQWYVTKTSQWYVSTTSHTTSLRRFL